MRLEIQINEKQIPPDKQGIVIPGVLAVTPALDEDYWFMRVPLTDKQAIVAFPKFSTYGIGFQHEDDWNTNLPYVCGAEEIYDHIKHNKGNSSIRRERCLKAIRMLQEAIAEMKGEDLDQEITRFATVRDEGGAR